MSLGSSIRDAALTSGVAALVSGNAPAEYADRQRQYFDGETRRFTQEYARYASDFVSARVQGLDPRDPWGWTTARLRMADVIRPHGAITRHFDDYKMVQFESAGVEYLRPGAMIETMGSVWLVTNPANISGGGAGIVQRCNAVWNHLDYYGNVVGEPFVVENERANANDSDQQASQLITKGYFNVVCQYNDFTAQLDTNSRVILGKGAYRVTGFPPLLREFTGDEGSVRLLKFTLRYEEPNAEIDDLENHVAGGKTFRWEIFLTGQSVLAPGTTAAFTARSARNGGSGVEVVDELKNDVFYIWETGDAGVAAADVHGNVSAVAEGRTALRCTLAQNQSIFTEIELNVTADAAADRVEFLDIPPENLRAFEECDLRAAFFADGEQTEEELSFTFSGAEPGSYGAAVGPRAVTVYCYGCSAEPLTVTARYGECAASVEIRLEGI